jgi:MinD superfamily P-loop ATPase
VRRLAKETAKKEQADYILIDGPPGIGCPVIASLSNASALVIVTEPTLSGLHDVDRLLDLADHFKLRSLACINKWDLHQETTETLERHLAKRGVHPLGRIPFDEAVVASQLAGRPLVEFSKGPAAKATQLIWQELMVAISQLESTRQPSIDNL